MVDRIEDGGPAEAGHDLVDRLAVKAAMISLGEKIAWGSQTDLMHEAAAEITRLRAENEDGGQAVRTLIWVHRPAGAATSERYDAETRFGRYSVYLRDNGVVEWGWASSPPITDAASEEAAKAAAQADFESRILSEIIAARARQIGLSVGSAEA